jgi:hypothetical protein
LKQTITVERHSQYAIYAAGSWFQPDNKLKAAGVSLGSFADGASYDIEGFFDPTKKTKYISAFTPHGAAPAAGGSTPPPIPAAAPSLPPAAAPSSPAAPASPSTLLPAGGSAAPSSPAATPPPARDTAYGRPLSDYERRKDISIRVSGILQAVVQSPMAPVQTGSPSAYINSVGDRTRELLDLQDSIVTERLAK